MFPHISIVRMSLLSVSRLLSDLEHHHNSTLITSHDNLTPWQLLTTPPPCIQGQHSSTFLRRVTTKVLSNNVRHWAAMVKKCTYFALLFPATAAVLNMLLWYCTIGSKGGSIPVAPGPISQSDRGNIDAWSILEAKVPSAPIGLMRQRHVGPKVSHYLQSERAALTQLF